MSADEAVDRVMRAENCSRRTARRLIAKHMKSGALPYRTFDKKLPKPEWLKPHDAQRALLSEPENLFLPLGEVMHRYHFTPDELLPELRAGRLIATAAGGESQMLAMELGGFSFSVNHFLVSAEHLIEWVDNPETPQELRDKYFRRKQVQ
jgi:hypothetical protein